MTVAIGVYEKRGLCRGPFIPNATFRRFGYLGFLPAIAPGPLDPDPVYTVTVPAGGANLLVEAPNYQSWHFDVMDKEKHYVWLDRRP
jgi:hypothetical protein